MKVGKPIRFHEIIIRSGLSSKKISITAPTTDRTHISVLTPMGPVRRPTGSKTRPEMDAVTLLGLNFQLDFLSLTLSGLRFKTADY